MLHVGLTGNIASGKSSASLKFAELGARVIDADKIVHELLSSGTKTFQKIVDTFGDEILQKDGSLDRKKLGKIVFFDAEKRRRLNRLTHPEVGKEILRRIDELEKLSPRGIVIVDAPLIVETGSQTMYHRLVVVSCGAALQVSRLIKRDNLTLEEAKARIDSQMQIEEKLKLADYSIDTSGTLTQTYEQVESIYTDLLVQEMHINEEKS